jgi:hypothetical protein
MQNPKYLLAGVAIGGLMFLLQPAAANPLAAGLIGSSSATSKIPAGLAEEVKHYKRHKHYSKHRYHRRYRHHYRRFYDDDDDYYPYFSSYPYYCGDWYGYCGYPRRHRHPGFIFVSPYFSFGF